MAIAGRWLGQHFNRPDFPMFDYDVYALGGDGCMMEGISNEAASLAGHLKLSNLCWIYDNNHITIEGHTALAFSDDVAVRFLGYGWNVTRVGDANDLDMLERAFRVFKDTTDRPTLIIVDSHIAYGAPNKQDTSAAHGEPLGEEEIRLTKKNYGWPEDAKFLVPDGVREHFQSQLGQRGAAARAAWMAKFDAYKKKYPESADHILMMQHRELPAGWDKALAPFPADPKGLATRDSSGKVLNAVCPERAVADRRRGRPVPVDEDAAHLRGRGRFRGRVVRRAQFPLRHPRARDDRHLQRHVAVEGAARSARASSSSATMRAAPSGCPRSWSCRSSTSSPTTRSASARTARRTSPSSSSPRCARCPT